jgi:hypothetical protein
MFIRLLFWYNTEPGSREEGFQEVWEKGPADIMLGAKAKELALQRYWDKFSDKGKLSGSCSHGHYFDFAHQIGGVQKFVFFT